MRALHDAAEAAPRARPAPTTPDAVPVPSRDERPGSAGKNEQGPSPPHAERSARMAPSIAGAITSRAPSCTPARSALLASPAPRSRRPRPADRPRLASAYAADRSRQQLRWAPVTAA
ncbi:hypothetical protein SCE1572_19605 [Sorangium cellulosum So0157-2]|uniref:Uncharacterized protein n=1 Tax=Sorangium cellulosum So0157-2 TaxID=1254432 RepID=S4Y0T5_SORCE|nr:hypothetical protein SCE1572_19605 [Sorangium cellulosum So0157-2]